MATERQVTAKADGDVMTLGELKAFIAELDEAGAADTTTLQVRVGWGQKLRSITATVVRFGDPEPR
jgi:hypothetical protein